MKKVIIAALIVIATGVTAISEGKNFEEKTVIKTVKIDKAEFMNKGAFSAQKSDVSSAD